MLQGFDESIGHAAGLRAGHRREARCQVECPGKQPRIPRGLSRTVVREMLYDMRGFGCMEAFLNSLQHHVAHIQA